MVMIQMKYKKSVKKSRIKKKGTKENINFLILGEGLNLFDLIVIDLLWWRNSKRIRFSCVPQIEMYKNPRKHIESFFRGIIFSSFSLFIGVSVVVLSFILKLSFILLLYL